MYNGLFIVFEGIDGAGLSTHAALLQDYLEKKGFEVVLTKEPTDGLIGGLIKAALRGEWRTDPQTLQLLFAADRSHHVEHYIVPALKEGKVVISDRYMYSSFAYGSLSCDYEWLKRINSKFPKADMLILLDLEPEIAIRRIKRGRFGFELFEDIKRLHRVRSNYLKILEEYSGFIVNTNRSIKEVHGEIVRIVERALEKSALKTKEGSEPT
ncbi:MAG: dTMP kinase [Thermoprotei archaeon]|nr:MAG: dTMP kinase [Thermoprotei archaeon]RLF01988.1 MAG: dTMP kinase [Thermoprotei archaeon]